MTAITNEQVRKALAGSIEKWERVAAGKEPDGGSEDCALCDLFNRIDCEGCPIKAHTGLSSCVGSPYVAWDRVCQQDPRSFNLAYTANTQRKINLAKTMLDFLVMLDNKFFVEGVEAK